MQQTSSRNGKHFKVQIQSIEQNGEEKKIQKEDCVRPVLQAH